jgi:XrtJ-associated TM-motif-TM protein
MRRIVFGCLGCALVLLVAAPLYGQTGCTDSPENPTVVLALVGGAGALFSVMRSRLRARHGRRKCAPNFAQDDTSFI